MRLVARARSFLSTPISAHLEGLRRDLRMLVGPLRGERPSPTLVRARVDRPLDLASRSRRLRIAEVIRETPSAVTLRFAQPVGAPLTWLAGQFLTLIVPTPAGPLRRAYSLSAPPAAPGEVVEPCVTIKRLDGGAVSTQLVEHTTAGQWLEVRGPSGSFVFEPDVQASRHLVLIGGGSGITPLMAILEAAMEREPGARVTLLYGNRRREEVIFHDRLERLAQRFGGRLVVRHVLEEPSAPEAGRLDRERLARELEVQGATAADLYYVCGPEGLMDGARALLTELGLAERLREERFQSFGERRLRALPSEPQRVRYAWRSGALEAEAHPGETLLEAGLRAGAPMAFSCTMGGCGACRVRVTAGEVAHDEPNGLSPAEREAGFAFACIARPLGPCSVEVPR